jgi:hypothetical protein
MHLPKQAPINSMGTNKPLGAEVPAPKAAPIKLYSSITRTELAVKVPAVPLVSTYSHRQHSLFSG